MQDELAFTTLLRPYRPYILAEVVGVTDETVRNWQRGTTAPNRPEVIQALAAFLRIDVAALLDVIRTDSERRSVA